MEPKFADLLKSLPPKKPRSRLEPYAKLVCEMRKRGLSYREIARVLRNQLGLAIGASTINDFVLTHTKRKRITKKSGQSFSRTERNQKALTDTVRTHRAVESICRNDKESDSSRLSKPARKPRFEYNPEEPLRIQRK